MVNRPSKPGGCLRQVVPSKGVASRHHEDPRPYTVMETPAGPTTRWRRIRCWTVPATPPYPAPRHRT